MIKRKKTLFLILAVFALSILVNCCTFLLMYFQAHSIVDSNESMIDTLEFNYSSELFSIAVIHNENLKKIHLDNSTNDCELVRKCEMENGINNMENTLIATTRYDINNDKHDEIVAYIGNSYFCGVHDNGAIVVYEIKSNCSVIRKEIVTPVHTDLNKVNESVAVLLSNNQVEAMYIEGKIEFLNLSK